MNHREYRHTAPHLRVRSSLHLGLLSLGLLGVLETDPAWAQQAETCDLSCPRGTTCEIMHPCTAIFCPEDQPDCNHCEGPGTPVCAPAACTTDSDCDDSMKCYEFVDDCAPDPLLVPTPGPNGEPGQNPPGCVPSSHRLCELRWQLPCTIDSDCGEGFRCEEFESCGSNAAGEVTCTPTGQFICNVIATSCTTDADCPADFACIDGPVTGECSMSADGGCLPPNPNRACQPRPIGEPLPPGDLGTTTSAQTAEPIDASASEGGCSLNGPASPSPLALFSTLGLGLALRQRRRSNTR